MSLRSHRRDRLQERPFLRWGAVVLVLLLSLAALIFQISADILPIALLSVAAILTVVNLLPNSDLGL